MEHERQRRRAARSQDPAVRSAPPPSLLSHMGNRAATRLLAPRRTLSRFESNEHKLMGDLGSDHATMELVPGFRITFGDMTAMAGDYFGTLDDMRAVAGTPHGLQEIKYVLFVEVRKEMKEEQFPKDVVNAAKRRYFGLAAKNVSHFTNPELGDEFLSQQAKAAKGSANNAGSYRDNHAKAIEAAVAAGAAKGGALDQAMLYEGFASHFLTDAFAAGHTRTPRHAIGDWWNPRVPMFWHNLKLWLAENIAHHMNEHSVAGYPLTVNFLWGQAIDTLERVMREKGIPDLTFGDAISGALHDLDNLEGVDATVGGGYGKVHLYGDGQVLDKQDRVIDHGLETLNLAAAGVKASLRDIQDAFKAAQAGQTDPKAVEASLRTPDGLYRAEQLWPVPLPNAQVANPTLPWMVATVDELLSKERVQVALTEFAHEKADTLGGEVKLDPPLKEAKEAALKWTLAKLKQDQKAVVGVFTQIINYTPGITTAGPSGAGEGELTGLFGDESDDNAVAYYRVAKRKGVLATLTLAQRIRLIRLGLDGPTLGDDEEMIVGLLESNKADAVKVLDAVGWRRVWSDVDGANCRRFVRSMAPLYWPHQSYERKRAEVKHLADGVTGEIAEETIIAILRTCTGAEVRRIDKEVGGRLGLSWDLDGAEQDEFDRLRARP